MSEAEDRDFEVATISILNAAAADLMKISVKLRLDAEIFDATNLSVSDATVEIAASLERDALFLKKLADIVEGLSTVSFNRQIVP